MCRLPRSFYTRRTITVAKDLLGKIFVRKIGRTMLKGIIVETEAYLFNDPASHSFKGETSRNRMMFEEGGNLYVYFTYGMHYCANVVTNMDGVGEAVLIRAVEPLLGLKSMAKRRGFGTVGVKPNSRQLVNLTNGPAKFAQAFQLTRRLSGTDLVKDGSMYIAGGDDHQEQIIVSAHRIGISAAKDKRWRFYLKGNIWVSKT